MTTTSLPDVPSTDLDISGMTCAACAGRIEHALRVVPGVTEASVNLTTEQARVQGGAADDAPIAAVAAAGYQTRVATDEIAAPAAVEPDFWEGIGPVCITAALSVPFVLPMIAGWFGANWMLPSWAQWLLATPVQSMIDVRSYKADWKVLRAGVGNMDLLVTLGTSAAHGPSLWL